MACFMLGAIAMVILYTTDDLMYVFIGKSTGVQATVKSIYRIININRLSCIGKFCSMGLVTRICVCLRRQTSCDKKQKSVLVKDVCN